MIPRDLRHSLSLVQLATFATLLRSVALDRWITVGVSVALLVAAYAAQRGRTWGVALSFALGITLAGVAALGIAPLWFACVGLLAVRPFVRLFRLFTRFDRGAAVTLAALGAGVGAMGAVAWKEYALALFRALPLLTPSLYPHHGLALLALLAGAIVGRRLLRGATQAESGDSVARIATDSTEQARVRVAGHEDDAVETAAHEELESELDTHRSRSVTRP